MSLFPRPTSLVSLLTTNNQQLINGSPVFSPFQELGVDEVISPWGEEEPGYEQGPGKVVEDSYKAGFGFYHLQEYER